MDTPCPWFLVHLGLILALITLVTSTERKFHERPRYRWFVLQGVVNWVGFEMIRSFIPFLGTMGFVANTQASQAWLIQPVSIFSIYGLGLIILLTNFALAQVGLALIDRRWPVEDAVPVDVRSTRRWAVGVGIGLAAWIGLSLIIPASITEAYRLAPFARALLMKCDQDNPVIHCNARKDHNSVHGEYGEFCSQDEDAQHGPQKGEGDGEKNDQGLHKASKLAGQDQVDQEYADPARQRVAKFMQQHDGEQRKVFDHVPDQRGISRPTVVDPSKAMMNHDQCRNTSIPAKRNRRMEP